MAFLSAQGLSPDAVADAAQMASLVDETPGGPSPVVLAKHRYA